MLEEIVLWIERAKEFGPLLSGVGSLAAVVLTLLYSARRTRPRLQIHTDEVHFGPVMYTEQPPPKHLQIHIVNLGEIGVTIAYIGCVFGWGRPLLVTTHPQMVDTSGSLLPHTLAFGQEARFFFFLEAAGSWQSTVARGVINGRAWYHFPFYRVAIGTSTGQLFFYRLPRRTIQRAKKAMAQLLEESRAH